MRGLGILILVLLGMAAQAKEEKQVTRSWKVPADFEQVLAAGLSTRDPFFFVYDEELGFPNLYLTLFDAGIKLSTEEIRFSPWTGVLELTGTEKQLKKFDAIYQKLGSLPQFVIDPDLLRRLPDPEADARRASVERIGMKLESIILPSVDFDDTTVAEAVEFLRRESRLRDTEEKDPKKRGINFKLYSAGKEVDRDPELEVSSSLEEDGPERARVRQLKLENVSVATVLQYLCGKSRLRYRVTHEAVEMLEIGSAVSVLQGPFFTGNWIVNPKVLDHFFGRKVETGEVSLVEMAEELGLAPHEIGPGTSLRYDRKGRILEMVNEDGVLDGIHRCLEESAIVVTRETEITRTWKVPADFVEVLAKELAEGEDSPEVVDPFEPGPKREDGDWKPGPFDLRDVLEEGGFWGFRGSIDFSPWKGVLTLTGPRVQLLSFDLLYREMGPMRQFVIDPTLLQREHDPERVARQVRVESYEEKLKTIILPSVDIGKNATLGEVISVLQRDSVIHDKATKDPKERGVNLTLVEAEELESAQVPPLRLKNARVSPLRLKNVSIAVALQYVIEASRIRYRITPEGVEILPIPWANRAPSRYTARWIVDPEVVDLTFGKKPQSGKVSFQGLAEELELEEWQYGPETSATYDREAQVFEMVNEDGVLDGFHGLLEKSAIVVTRERLPKKNRK